MSPAAAAVALAILRLTGGRDPNLSERIAPAAAEAAQRYRLDPLLLTALIWHETGGRIDAIGRRGELGLGQLKRHTLATRGYDHMTDAELMDPAINLMLTARHMARVRRLCPGNLVGWLSVYSGVARCRPTAYSRAVIKLRREMGP